MEPTMLLIDASSFIHRAFHAATPRVTTKGEHVAALYITIKMLRNLVNQQKPKWVATVFDHPGDNFRHYLYPGYKANRPPKPTELEFQIEKVRLFSGAMGLNPIIVSEVEADDVIATLARSASESEIRTQVATRDKDLAAVVNSHVSLIDKDGNITDVAKVEEKYGVSPEQICDLLTLTGDDSDNIPGIQGLGIKKAANLVNKYGSLDMIIASSKAIPGVIGERIRDNAETLKEMRQIVRLENSLCIMKDHEQYARRGLNIEALMQLFEQFEFHDMRDKLMGHMGNTSTSN
ncbi:5'-3' exonuclease [Microbulbifer epialgicus]|uniref:5'-3' exonuclease H3TH domain-containing protein n=1 Tax=Microbulbifer epialgicus TaxID=393907 RepID=A0ABV4NUU4_9GAMM